MNFCGTFVNIFHTPTLSRPALLFLIMTALWVDWFPFTFRPLTYKSMRSTFPVGLSFCFLSSVHTITKHNSTTKLYIDGFPNLVITHLKTLLINNCLKREYINLKKHTFSFFPPPLLVSKFLYCFFWECYHPPPTWGA